MGAGRRFVRSATAAVVRLVPALGIVACRDEPTGATAPFSIEASLWAEPGNTVGTILRPSPTFVVRNSLGDVLANVPVTVTITTGNGTLRNVPVRTTTGLTAIGEWTLDTIAGSNQVTIVAGSAPPVRITVVGIAGAPATVAPDGGVPEGFAGDFLSGFFALRVRDRYGNPVGGAGIDLSVIRGGGEVSPPSLMTDGNGIASGIAWRLGRSGGAQLLSAAVGDIHVEVAASIRSAFDPVVRLHGAPLPGNVASALTMAVDRIHAGIVADVSDVPILNFDMSRCGLQGVTLNETVDDLVIFAIVTPIDGVGRVLASAGPCVLRTQSRFPVVGVMRFDADDISALAANGRLPAVVLHEMLHVIGIGTLWRNRDMLFGSGTTDPRFIGLLAGAQCIAAGGFAGCTDGRVPVENLGGSGTREAHWRESIFDREVMTGFVEADDDMPFSSMSIASLQDLGYVANLLSADPYTVPTPGTVAPRLSPQVLPAWESLHLPLFEVTTTGWVRPIVPR